MYFFLFSYFKKTAWLNTREEEFYFLNYLICFMLQP
jgi:hypothetical protein